MPACRLYPFESADGPLNMARDETLLHAAADQGLASLRFYSWSEATLSLGYFQAHAARHDDAALAGLPFVRRASGGSAIVHHHELTYALALPGGAGWQSRQPWTCRMHQIIIAALARFGVAARAVECGEEKKLGPFLCFRHQTPGDLVIEGHKVAGSAQRKARGAIVQHGSILLRQSPHTPSLPGIAELFRTNLAAPELAGAIQTIFQQDTGWQLEAADWTDADLAHVERIREGKYASEEWNRKR